MPGDAGIGHWKLPERYARTEMYFALRAARGYGTGGVDPLLWWDGLGVATQRQLLVMERVLAAEEERAASMIAAAGARRGMGRGLL